MSIDQSNTRETGRESLLAMMYSTSLRARFLFVFPPARCDRDNVYRIILPRSYASSRYERRERRDIRGIRGERKSTRARDEHAAIIPRLSASPPLEAPRDAAIRR
jgi:hypothetical protein